MNEHVSELVLDSLALNRAVPAAARAHLDSCEACQKRLESVHAEQRDFIELPQRSRVLRALAEERSRSRTPLRWPWALAPIPLAVAAALAFIVVPRQGGDRVKGHAAIAIVDRQGDRILTARPSDEVGLVVAPAGARYVLVLGLDEPSGRLAVLWPPQGNRSGPAPSRAEAPLFPSFSVTPGPLTMIALFSDEPLEAAGVVERLQSAPNGPASAPPLPGERSRATTRLRVGEAP